MISRDWNGNIVVVCSSKCCQSVFTDEQNVVYKIHCDPSCIWIYWYEKNEIIQDDPPDRSLRLPCRLQWDNYLHEVHCCIIEELPLNGVKTMRIVCCLHFVNIQTVSGKKLNSSSVLPGWWYKRGCSKVLGFFFDMFGISMSFRFQTQCAQFAKLGAYLSNKAHILVQIGCFLQQFGIVMGHEITLFEV